jgi:hypothetical protein
MSLAIDRGSPGVTLIGAVGVTKVVTKNRPRKGAGQQDLLRRPLPRCLGQILQCLAVPGLRQASLLDLQLQGAPMTSHATTESKLIAELSALTAKVRFLEIWVADLQSGMYVNCVYCGHRYGPGDTTPVSMADALRAHVAACPAHPMSGLVKAVMAACDLLAERTQGGPARSPGHNARLLLEEALLAATGKPTPGGLR